jgi:hypothetical protein
MRHNSGGSQVHPDSSITSFSSGKRLNTPSVNRLVSWYWKVWALAM